MTATGNGGAITGTLNVSGWAGSALAFDWPGVNFQGVSEGSTGNNPWPVKVINNSGQALAGLSYAFTGGVNYQSGAFTINDPNNCFGNTLAAGANCSFNIVPTPQTSQTLGAYTATLVVSAGGYSTYGLPVSGTANAGGLSINWNQNQQDGVSTIDFGPQNTVGQQSGPWPITVYNNTPTAETLTLTPSLGVFTIDGSNNSCASSVPAGGSCTFGLDFTPTAVTSYQGTLTITGSVSGSYTFNTWGTANK
jgi:hypothetical protein